MENKLDDLRNLLINNPPSSLDQNDLNYKYMGVVWEEMVHSHIDNHEIEFLTALGLKKLDVSNVSFSHIFPYPSQNQLKDEERNYGIFDILITTRSHLPDYIIEVKLNPGNIGLKEMKYLYYKSDAILVGIFLFPLSIKYPNQLFQSIKEKLEPIFNMRYKPTEKFILEDSKMIFLGSQDIGIFNTTPKHLRKYLDRRVGNISRLLFLLFEIFPKYLIIDDFCTILSLYHNYVRRIIRILDNYDLLEIQEGDTYDSKGRVVSSTTLYRLEPSKIELTKLQFLIKDLIQQFKITLPELSNYGRDYFPILVRENDESILCYLNHFPSRWISVPDLLQNVTFSSQGELRRRLASLTEDGWIIEQEAYQLDLVNRKSRTYAARFYKLVSLPKELDVCSCRQLDPTQQAIPVQLSYNELSILHLLHANQINQNNPVTIKDVANSLDLNPSTVNIAVKRLAQQQDIPLELTQQWVLSTTKTTRMRSSPVIYLNSVPDHYFRELDFGLRHLTIQRTVQIITFPLTPNECEVVQAVMEGYDCLDKLVIQVHLHPKPKSNRSMINSIVKKLLDTESMTNRKIDPVLQYKENITLHPSYDNCEVFHQHLNSFSGNNP